MEVTEHQGCMGPLGHRGGRNIFKCALDYPSRLVARAFSEIGGHTTAQESRLLRRIR